MEPLPKNRSDGQPCLIMLVHLHVNYLLKPEVHHYHSTLKLAGTRVSLPKNG